MTKIMVFINKIITWLKMNAATVCGLAQAVVKAIKEIVTGLINLLSIFAFTAAAEALVIKVRGWLDIVDGWIQIAKDWLLINIQ